MWEAQLVNAGRTLKILESNSLCVGETGLGRGYGFLRSQDSQWPRGVQGQDPLFQVISGAWLVPECEVPGVLAPLNFFQDLVCHMLLILMVGNRQFPVSTQQVLLNI